jgi:hypothetical protein
MVLLNPMFPTPSTFSAKKITLMTLNQLMKEISQWNTTLINRTGLAMEQEQKNTCKTSGQYRYCSRTILVYLFIRFAHIHYGWFITI